MSTLALGMGAATLAFVITDAALDASMLGVRDDGLVWVGETDGEREDGTSFVSIDRWARASRSVERVSAFMSEDMRLGQGADASQIVVAAVSWDFFRTLRAFPQVGRTFLPADEHEQEGAVVVLSDSIWRARFGAALDIVGRRTTLNATAYTVIGVMPRDFEFPASGTAAWVPVDRVMSEFATLDGGRFVWGVARLNDGATAETAAAELRRIEASARAGGKTDGYHIFVHPLRAHLTRELRPRLQVLTVAAIITLMLACANVGNMLLGQLLRRRDEMGLRLALGAGRGHLIGLLAAEAGMLLAGGVAAGVAVAFVGATIMARFASGRLPELTSSPLTWRAVVMALALSGVVTLIIASAAYVQLPEARLSDRLRAASSRLAAAGRFRNALIATGVALTSVLLVSAGVLGKTYFRLSQGELGIDPRNVYTARVARPIVVFTSREWPSVQAFMRQLLKGLAAAPGVTGVALSTQSFGSGNAMKSWASGVRRTDSARIGVQAVTSRYFEVLRIPIRAGRVFTQHEDEGGEPVAVIDETLRERLFDDISPLGREIVLTSLGLRARIVGVTAAVRQGGPTARGEPQVYLAYSQLPLPWVTVLARSQMASTAAYAELRRVLLPLDVSQPVERFERLSDALASRLDRSRFYAALLASIAVVTTILTAVTLYGTVTLAVTQRRREVGIRMSLGASPRAIMLLLLRDSLTPVAGGLLLGSAVALAGTRLLTTLLYGVSPFDLGLFGFVAAFVAVVCAVAALRPAISAASLVPADALRAD